MKRKLSMFVLIAMIFLIPFLGSAMTEREPFEPEAYYCYEKDYYKMYNNSSSVPDYIDYRAGDHWGRLYLVSITPTRGGVQAFFQGSLCNDIQLNSLEDEIQ